MPTYVVEFMLGRYCASTDPKEIDEGLEMVQRQLPTGRSGPARRNCSRPARANKGSVKIIDIITARLDAKTDSYLATLPSLRLNDVRIGDKLVQRPRADADRRLLRRGRTRLRRRASPRRRAAGHSRS